VNKAQVSYILVVACVKGELQRVRAPYLSLLTGSQGQQKWVRQVLLKGETAAAMERLSQLLAFSEGGKYLQGGKSGVKFFLLI